MGLEALIWVPGRGPAGATDQLQAPLTLHRLRTLTLDRNTDPDLNPFLEIRTWPRRRQRRRYPG